MILPGQLTSMREHADALLPDTAVIYRRTLASDGGGGHTETWVAAASDVPCRLSPTGGGEPGEEGARVKDEVRQTVTLPAGQDIQEEDAVVVGEVAFDVTVVLERHTWEINRRAHLVRSTTPADAFTEGS